MFSGTKDLEVTLTYFFFALLAILSISNGHSIEKRYVDEDTNVFDMEIFRAANEYMDDGDSDILISPLSLRIALGMVLEGSRNETATEIRTALKLPDDPTFWRSEPKKWINMLKVNDRTNTVLKTANRIFVDATYTIKDDYNRNLRDIYEADVRAVNKGDPEEAANEINDWVKRNTNGMIPKIIDKEEIKEDFVLAEANTIYFKGKWLYQFQKKDTQLDCFYKNDSPCAKTPMMWSKFGNLSYAYISELDSEVIDLPYDDKKHSMLIVLPKKRNGIHQLVEEMKSYTTNQISSKLRKTWIEIKIPKFKAEYRTDMRRSLVSLNIERVFGPAQFSMVENMDGALYVSQVIHSSKMEVNEEGTEAAAATLVQIVSVAADSQPRWTYFTADHPFLYFLRDVSTNAVLFAGKYNGPKKD